MESLYASKISTTMSGAALAIPDVGGYPTYNDVVNPTLSATELAPTKDSHTKKPEHRVETTQTPGNAASHSVPLVFGVHGQKGYGGQTLARGGQTTTDEGRRVGGDATHKSAWYATTQVEGTRSRRSAVAKLRSDWHAPRQKLQSLLAR